MMGTKWLRRAWVAAVPLVLAAVAMTPPASAVAATACQAWNGGQPVSPGTVGNEVTGLAVVSACDVWAVGFAANGNAFKTSQPLIEHWTGGSWTTVPSPGLGIADLTGVAALSASSIWAVGDTRASVNGTTTIQTLILHWDGTSWTRVPSPTPGSTFAVLNSVDVVSANDAWAVGYTGTKNRRPLSLHWDGSAWTQIAIPDPHGNSSLTAVSATSASDAWAVGNLPPNLLAYHWDGTSWTLRHIPNPGGGALRGVSAVSASDAWAVGSDQVGTAAQATFTVHWDGTSWTQVPSPTPGGPAQNSDLEAVTVTSSGDAWAVGSFGTASQEHPLVLHWDGGAWIESDVTVVNQGAGNHLIAVAASAARQAWVGGTSTNISTAFAAPVPVVPDVTGRTVNGAHAELMNFGLDGHATGQTTNCPASLHDLVITTDPAAGQQAPFGSIVGLTVCVTPSTVTVPNVLGSDDTSAQNAITASGLTVGDISLDNRCIADAGTVLTQNPSGGVQAQPGSAVTLTESSGVTSQGKPCVFL
jgi:hypothetical protein